jgi:hypothetical protein
MSTKKLLLRPATEKCFVSISSPLFADGSRSLERFFSGLLFRSLGSFRVVKTSSILETWQAIRFRGSRVGGGALTRWPPSAAQTAARLRVIGARCEKARTGYRHGRAGVVNRARQTVGKCAAGGVVYRAGVVEEAASVRRAGDVQSTSVIDRARVGDRVGAAARTTVLQVDRALVVQRAVLEKSLELKKKFKSIVPLLLNVPELRKLPGSNIDVSLIVPRLLNAPWLKRSPASIVIVPELAKEPPAG